MKNEPNRNSRVENPKIEIKNSLECPKQHIWTSRVNNQQPEDRKTEIIQFEEQDRRKKKKNNEEWWIGLQRCVGHYQVHQNIHSGSPRRREEKGTEKYLKKKMLNLSKFDGNHWSSQLRISTNLK